MSEGVHEWPLSWVKQGELDNSLPGQSMVHMDTSTKISLTTLCIMLLLYFAKAKAHQLEGGLWVYSKSCSSHGTVDI